MTSAEEQDRRRRLQSEGKQKARGGRGGGRGAVPAHLFWMSAITCEYVFPRTLSPLTFTSRSPGEQTTALKTPPPHPRSNDVFSRREEVKTQCVDIVLTEVCLISTRQHRDRKTCAKLLPNGKKVDSLSSALANRFTLSGMCSVHLCTGPPGGPDPFLSHS